MSDEKQDKQIIVVDRLVPVKLDKSKVIADNIRKEVNFLEDASRRSCVRKYRHLTGQFFHEVLAEECRKAGLPVDTFERDPPEDAVERSPIPLKPSPAFPRTTSAEIGHRSSRAEYSLEFVGRLYVSPKWTIEPPTDTPELHATQQRFLFLG